MSVAHDAVSESHTGTTGSVSEDLFQFTHTPAGTPKGVLIYVMISGTATDLVGVVDYGGVTVPAVTGGRAQDAAGEPGSCKAFFLGASVPTGPVTVTINRTNTADTMYAVCITVTAAEDETEYTGVITANSGTLAEINIDDGSPGSDSMRYAGMYSGLNDVPGVGSNSVSLISIDFGLTLAAACRELTAGQGARPVGFSSGTGDDLGIVYLAVREIIPAGGGTLVINKPRSIKLLGGVSKVRRMLGYLSGISSGQFPINDAVVIISAAVKPKAIMKSRFILEKETIVGRPSSFGLLGEKPQEGIAAPPGGSGGSIIHVIGFWMRRRRR